MTLQRFLSILLISIFILVSSTAVAADDETTTISTVPDNGTSGMFLATLCPSKDVAISADDAEVFSIYVDVNTAIFSQLRTRGGMYVVKAGQPVVIKTTEAKTIELQTSTKALSVIWSDLVSPADDMSTADFREANNIGDDLYIYMLTNMERNGGFGLTHFVGDTLLSGKLFIVCSRVPETTGIQYINRNSLTTDAPIFNLQGQRIVNPISGELYIRSGRKYIYRDNESSGTALPAVTRSDVVFEDGDLVPFLPGEAGNDNGF